MSPWKPAGSWEFLHCPIPGWVNLCRRKAPGKIQVVLPRSWRFSRLLFLAVERPAVGRDLPGGEDPKDGAPPSFFLWELLILEDYPAAVWSLIFPKPRTSVKHHYYRDD